MISERYAKEFCKDDISLIENYDKAVSDTTQTWECHHRLELTLDGEFALSREELKLHDMYYHRPYFELIFLTKAEHRSMHHKSKTLSPEHKAKLSESHKGKKIRPHTAEHRAKIAEARRKYWAKKKVKDLEKDFI